MDIRLLTPNDVPLMEALLTFFGQVFDDVETYTANRSSKDYSKLGSREEGLHFDIALGEKPAAGALAVGRNRNRT